MDQSGKKVPEAQSRIFDEAEARNAAGGDVGFMSSLTNDRLQQQGQMYIIPTNTHTYISTS